MTGHKRALEEVAALLIGKAYTSGETLVVELPDHSIVRLRVVGFDPVGVCRVCHALCGEGRTHCKGHDPELT